MNLSKQKQIKLIPTPEPEEIEVEAEADVEEVPGAKPKKTDVMMIAGVPAILRHRFKMATFAQNTTMRAVILLAIAAYIKNYEEGDKNVSTD
jgi:hypothetical protein